MTYVVRIEGPTRNNQKDSSESVNDTISVWSERIRYLKPQDNFSLIPNLLTEGEETQVKWSTLNVRTLRTSSSPCYRHVRNFRSTSTIRKCLRVFRGPHRADRHSFYIRKVHDAWVPDSLITKRKCQHFCR